MKLSVQFTLPCGHELEQSIVVDYRHKTDNQETAFKNAAEILLFWLKNRTERHDCALVGPDNPTGKKAIGT